jgi:glycosyltransferase involved in cell wall biosynthesis
MDKQEKVLYVTPVLLYPAAGGPALRVESSVKALSKICDLHIIARRSKYQTGGEVAIAFYKKLCNNLEFVPLERYNFPAYIFRKFIGLGRRILGRSIDPINLYPVNLIDAMFVINYAKKHSINIIWFSFGNISYDIIKLVKSLNPKLKLICDTDSVWSRFILRELPYEMDPKRKREIEEEGHKKQKEEIDWVKMCDVTTAVSEVDADFYRESTDSPEKIMPFSNVIDLDSYTYYQEPPAGFKKPAIFVAGTFYHNSPMEKATRWFIQDVFPIVKANVPEVHLYVIGIGSDTTLKDIDDPSITVTGLLDTVLPYLYNSDVSIVPLSFESGTRFKILEAAACGIPIVSTTLGAEGIPVTNEVDILIADSADDFAKGVVRVIKDKEFAKAIAGECNKLVKKHYSIEHLMREGLTILHSLKK